MQAFDTCFKSQLVCLKIKRNLAKNPNIEYNKWPNTFTSVPYL